MANVIEEKKKATGRHRACLPVAFSYAVYSIASISSR